MEEFLAYLSQFGSLNEQQLDLIASKGSTLALRKDAYLLEAGQVARQVAFVLEGVIRICYYDNKGNEITRNFIAEHRLATEPAPAGTRADFRRVFAGRDRLPVPRVCQARLGGSWPTP
ncbi:MAG: hypothetical protein WKG07_12495 [Hymenobacter sp.]